MPLNLACLAVAHSVACPRTLVLLAQGKCQALRSLKIAGSEIGLLGPLKKKIFRANLLGMLGRRKGKGSTGDREPTGAPRS